MNNYFTTYFSKIYYYLFPEKDINVDLYIKEILNKHDNMIKSYCNDLIMKSLAKNAVSQEILKIKIESLISYIDLLDEKISNL